MYKEAVYFIVQGFQDVTPYRGTAERAKNWTCFDNPRSNLEFWFFYHVCCIRVFRTKMVYLEYITCLRYTTLVRNPRYFSTVSAKSPPPRPQPPPHPHPSTFICMFSRTALPFCRTTDTVCKVAKPFTGLRSSGTRWSSGIILTDFGQFPLRRRYVRAFPTCLGILLHVHSLSDSLREYCSVKRKQTTFGNIFKAGRWLSLRYTGLGILSLLAPLPSRSVVNRPCGILPQEI